MKYNITISGMGCSHCIARVTNALNTIGADVDSVGINTAVVDFGSDVEPIKESIEELGFKVISIEAV